MPAAQLSLVTPEGVRDGDPAALSGLTTRRGAAVLAYAEQVAAPGRSVDAAAEAFAQFRRAVVAAEDPYDVDPERTLLRGTRFAAAAAAPRELPLRVRLRGSGHGRSPCELVPELLAARAEEELSAADGDRLSRHLARCGPCSAAEARFRAGERAYREAPHAPPVAFAARAIMEALLHCAPAPATAREADAPTEAAPSAPVPLAAPVEADAAAETAPEPQAAPVAVLTQEPPADFVPEPFDEEPYEYAPEPTVTHVTAAERQETYEFDALPDEAFDVAAEPVAAAEQAPDQRSAWTVVAFWALIVLVVLAVAALAIMVLALINL